MKKIAFFCNNGPQCPDFNRVFEPRFRARVQEQSELFSEVVTQANFDIFTSQMREIEVIFATWGMWPLSHSQLEAMSNLKAVFYAAGSVKHFAAPLLERGIVVASAWGANAVPVAEFALAQILLANKGYLRNVSEYRMVPGYDRCFRGRGNYGATVAILGAGHIGRKLIELLRPFYLRVLVFDPFLSYKAADILGVEKVETLEEVFTHSDIVSNHMADLPETVGMLRGEHFALMPSNATFINTGRGLTVNHDHLVAILLTRPDVTALLDVTDPEPLPLEHPLRTLPNVHISGHISGSIGDEVGRLGEVALAEFERWQCGEPLRYAVTSQMLETMA
ncbi:putative 2-hydroxyacid dehydrogenase YoaD [Abditibacteriota bacterium]|nr:putative 2-hydroxyacid dehydrogenase YoaD [Abditibacteriota bacterium]